MQGILPEAATDLIHGGMQRSDLLSLQGILKERILSRQVTRHLHQHNASGTIQNARVVQRQKGLPDGIGHLHG